MNLLPFLHSELAALAAEIMALSGLSRERLDDAAIELSIGTELCCGGPDTNPDGELDPYDEFHAFARDPDDARDEFVYAQKLKNAARKLIEDSVERDRSEPTQRRQ